MKLDEVLFEVFEVFEVLEILKVLIFNVFRFDVFDSRLLFTLYLLNPSPILCKDKDVLFVLHSLLFILHCLDKLHFVSHS